LAPRAGSRRYVIVPAKRIAAAGKSGCHDTFVSALGNARTASARIMIIFGSRIRARSARLMRRIVGAKNDAVVTRWIVSRYRSFSVTSDRDDPQFHRTPRVRVTSVVFARAAVFSDVVKVPPYL